MADTTHHEFGFVLLHSFVVLLWAIFEAVTCCAYHMHGTQLANHWISKLQRKVFSSERIQRQGVKLRQWPCWDVLGRSWPPQQLATAFACTGSLPSTLLECMRPSTKSVFLRGYSQQKRASSRYFTYVYIIISNLVAGGLSKLHMRSEPFADFCSIPFSSIFRFEVSSKYSALGIRIPCGCKEPVPSIIDFGIHVTSLPLNAVVAFTGC